MSVSMPCGRAWHVACWSESHVCVRPGRQATIPPGWIKDPTAKTSNGAGEEAELLDTREAEMLDTSTKAVGRGQPPPPPRQPHRALHSHNV